MFKAVRRVLPGPVSASVWLLVWERRRALMLAALAARLSSRRGCPPDSAPLPHHLSSLSSPAPLQYTFILLAGKELPKALSAPDKGGKAKKRHEVGVRLPGDPGGCDRRAGLSWLDSGLAGLLLLAAAAVSGCQPLPTTSCPDPSCPAVAQAILAQLDRPLLCSTAAATGGCEGGDDGAAEVMGDDAATLMDRYGPQVRRA